MIAFLIQLFLVASISIAASAAKPNAVSAASAGKPNLIFILCDDWGFANLGIHNPGNKNVVTPNIDRIISTEGLLLNRSYVFKYCSPSRSAFQTGRNPIHVNVLNSDITQHNIKEPLSGFQGAAVNFTGIGNKLKSVGYSTSAVGKWNAGIAYKKVTPVGRGYDSSLIYYDYDTFFFNGTRHMCKPQGITTDLSVSYGQSLLPATTLNNTWACSQSDQSANACPHGYQDDLFFLHVVDFVTNSSKNPNIPFFLFWAPHAPHDPYEVPDEYLQKFSFIDQPERKFYSAMVNYLDNNFGKLEAMLKSSGLWNNTLVVVSSDNGGPIGPGYGGNNWPLRGGKASNMEGGIRVNSFAFGGFLDPTLQGTVTNELVEIADWWSTFSLFGGADTTDDEAKAAGLPPPDSLDLRGLFVKDGNRTSPRETIFIGDSDSSDKVGNTIVAGVIRRDGWKLLYGKQSMAIWQGPVYPNSTVYPSGSLDCNAGCLFNVFDDPTEQNEVSKDHPQIVHDLDALIKQEQQTVWNPDRGTGDDNLACNVAFASHKGFMGPFLD